MGVIKRGLLGGFSGRVGNIVGSSWKGIAIIKSLPLSVANPKTAAQVAHRTDFGDTVGFAKNILAGVIKPLWDRFASQQSGFNAFVQANIKNLQQVPKERYGNFKMSIGKMNATELDARSINVNDSDIDFEWNPDTSGALQQEGDIGTAVMMVNDDISSITIKNNFLRDDGIATLSLGSSIAVGDKVHRWLCFKRADGTIVSPSSHTVSEVIA